MHLKKKRRPISPKEEELAKKIKKRQTDLEQMQGRGDVNKAGFGVLGLLGFVFWGLRFSLIEFDRVP